MGRTSTGLKNVTERSTGPAVIMKVLCVAVNYPHINNDVSNEFSQAHVL